jgi:hypothetical protein
MESDMERVKRSLAPELYEGIATSGVDWLVDFAAEMMATLTAEELDALADGTLRPSADALTALGEREHGGAPDEGNDETDDPDADLGEVVDQGGCQIVTFLHCAQCMDDRPDGQSPRDWARLDVGLTADRRLQVWCVRHDREVRTFRPAPSDIRGLSGCHRCGNGSSPSAP